MKNILTITILISLTSCQGLLVPMVSKPAETKPSYPKCLVSVEVRNIDKPEEILDPTVEVLFVGSRTKTTKVEYGNPFTIMLNKDRYLVKVLDQLEYQAWYNSLKGSKIVTEIRRDTTLVLYGEVK